MAREPLYKKAERELLARITDGHWPPGTRLPNEFVLAEEFGVSQGTMRRALITLEQLGHLSRKPGRGTEVVNPGAQAPRAASARLMLPDGSEPVFEIYRNSVSSRRPDDEEAALFGADRLNTLSRTLTCRNRRAALEEVAVPQDRVARLPSDLPSGFTDLVRSLNLSIATLEETVAAAVTTMSESVTLQCDRATALLCLVRLARDEDGTAMARQSLKIAVPGLTCRFG